MKTDPEVSYRAKVSHGGSEIKISRLWSLGGDVYAANKQQG